MVGEDPRFGTLGISACSCVLEKSFRLYVRWECPRPVNEISLEVVVVRRKEPERCSGDWDLGHGNNFKSDMSSGFGFSAHAGL